MGTAGGSDCGRRTNSSSSTGSIRAAATVCVQHPVHHHAIPPSCTPPRCTSRYPIPGTNHTISSYTPTPHYTIHHSTQARTPDPVIYNVLYITTLYPVRHAAPSWTPMAPTPVHHGTALCTPPPRHGTLSSVSPRHCTVIIFCTYVRLGGITFHTEHNPFIHTDQHGTPSTTPARPDTPIHCINTVWFSVQHHQARTRLGYTTLG